MKYYNKKQLKSILARGRILIMAFFIWIIAYPAFSIVLDSFPISDSLAGAVNPDIVWTRANYGLVWSGSRGEGEPEIYFARLNGFGQKLAREIKISDSSDKISDQPAIIWADNMYALVWSEYDREESKNKDGCNLYLTNLDKNGEKYGGIISVTSDNYGSCPSNPSLVWTGTNYGIAWHESRANTETSQIFFARVNALKERMGQEAQVSDTLNSSHSSLVWTGEEYGLVWQAEEGIYFTRLDADGKKQGNDIEISRSATSTNPSLAWHEPYYGVVWQGYDKQGQRQIYFAKLDKEGNRLTADIAITSNEEDDDSVSPSIIWGNSEYGLVWQQRGGAIYFVSLDIEGNKKSEILPISNANEGQAKQPAIALGTSQYAFAWQDSRGGGEEIYFAKLAFSDVSQGSLLAFIKIADGSIWLMSLLALMVMALLLGVVYRIKKKPQNIK